MTPVLKWLANLPARSAAQGPRAGVMLLIAIVSASPANALRSPAGGSSEDLAKHLAAETAKWRKVVQLSGAKAD